MIIRDYLGDFDGELQQARWRPWGEKAAISQRQALQGEKYLGGTNQAGGALARNWVSCKAGLEGPFKSHDGGETCYKHMISVGTASSPASLNDLRSKGDATAAHATVSEPEGNQGKPKGKGKCRPLADYVRFDKICKWDNKYKPYLHPVTGEALTAGESEDFKCYLQRHKERKTTDGATG